MDTGTALMPKITKECYTLAIKLMSVLCLAFDRLLRLYFKLPTQKSCQ